MREIIQEGTLGPRTRNRSKILEMAVERKQVPMAARRSYFREDCDKLDDLSGSRVSTAQVLTPLDLATILVTSRISGLGILSVQFSNLVKQIYLDKPARIGITDRIC